MRRVAWLPIVGGLLSIVPSCTSDNGTNDGGMTGMDGGMSSDAKPDKAPIEAAPGCDITMMCDSAQPDPMATCLINFDTQLLDVNGTPITTEKLFFCGTNLCTQPITPDAQGKIVLKGACNWFIRGAAKYIGETRFASFTSLAPMMANVSIAPLTLVALPAMGVDISGTGTFTSNNIALTTAGATIKFDPSEPNDADLHRFRAVQVPTGKFPPGTPANIEVAFGLAPVNAAITPSAKLSVPNPLNWPVNTVVEFYLNSVDGFDMSPPVPYGGWGKVSTGKVIDATHIETDPGANNGIPMIGMIGLHHL